MTTPIRYRCALCDAWYDPHDEASSHAHDHPEPESGSAHAAWLASGLTYGRWLQPTDEERLSQPNGEETPGAPPQTTAHASARQALALLETMHLPPAHVVASAAGGIGMAFILQDKYADIEFFNSGEILAVISSQHRTPDVWNVQAEHGDIQRTLEKICAHLYA